MDIGEKHIKEKVWWRLFEFGIALKAIKAVAEIAGGLFVLLTHRNTISGWLIQLNSIDDLGTVLHTIVARYIAELSSSTITFVGVYILLHGLTGIFIVINIYRNKLWAYLLMLYVTAGFMAYLVYRVFETRSPILIVFIVLDLLFSTLTWHEYKVHKQRIIL